MNMLKTMARLAAIAVATGLIMTPIASADRGDDRREHRRDYRDDRRDYRDDRRDYRDDRRDYRSDRRDYRDDRRDYRHDRRDYRKSYGHQKHYYRPHRPVVVYSPPPRAYYAPRPRVSIHYGPYYSHGYRPRYDVGGYYGYSPRRTVYISDYDRYGLYAPPHGHHWVRDHDSGDAILASVATGAIIGLFVGALAAD